MSTDALAYEAIQRVYRAEMVRFVRERLTTRYGTAALDRLRRPLKHQWDSVVEAAQRARASGAVETGPADPFDLLDVNALIPVVEAEFDVLFPPADQRPARADVLHYMRDVTALRNPISHPVEQPLSRDDARRAIDGARRVMHWVDQAAESKLRALLRRLDEDSDPPPRWSGQGSEQAYRESLQAALGHVVLPEGLGSASSPVSARLADLFVPPKLSAPENASHENAGSSWVTSLIRHPRVVVVGQAGAGKSTLARYIAWRLAAGDEPDRRLPVLVLAPDVAAYLSSDPDRTFLRYVSDHHSDRFGEPIRQAVERGECILLVDGLDEVVNAASRSRLIGAVERFCLDFPSVHVLVTTRPEAVRMRPLQGGFEQWMLDELDKPSADGLVRALLQAQAPDSTETDVADRATRIRDRLSAAGLAGFGHSPLLLRLLLIAVGSGAGSDDVATRAQIFDVAVREMVARAFVRRSDLPLSPDDVVRALGRLATWMLENRLGNRVARGHLAVWIGQEGDQPGAEADAKSLRTVLLEAEVGVFGPLDGHQPGSPFGFIHQTLLDYFAGRQLAERCLEGDVAILAGSWLDHRWREPALFGLGQLSLWTPRVATEAFGRLMSSDPPFEKFLHRRLVLTLEAVADGAVLDVDQRERVVRSAVAAALATPSAQVWSALEQALRRAWHDRSARGRADLSPREGDSDDALARKSVLRWHAGDRSLATYSELVTRLATPSPTIADDSMYEVIGEARLEATAGRAPHQNRIPVFPSHTFETLPGVPHGPACLYLFGEGWVVGRVGGSLVDGITARRILDASPLVGAAEDFESADPPSSRGTELFVIQEGRFAALPAPALARVGRHPLVSPELPTMYLGGAAWLDRDQLNELAEFASGPADVVDRVGALEVLAVYADGMGRETQVGQVDPLARWPEIVLQLACAEPDPSVRLRAILAVLNGDGWMVNERERLLLVLLDPEPDVNGAYLLAVLESQLATFSVTEADTADEPDNERGEGWLSEAVVVQLTRLLESSHPLLRAIAARVLFARRSGLSSPFGLLGAERVGGPVVSTSALVPTIGRLMQLADEAESTSEAQAYDAQVAQLLQLEPILPDAPETATWYIELLRNLGVSTRGSEVAWGLVAADGARTRRLAAAVWAVARPPDAAPPRRRPRLANDDSFLRAAGVRGVRTEDLDESIVVLALQVCLTDRLPYSAHLAAVLRPPAPAAMRAAALRLMSSVLEQRGSSDDAVDALIAVIGSDEDGTLYGQSYAAALR